MSDLGWSSGSRWCRWDPHIHAPGTLNNDQFKDDWDGYLKAIENADPGVVALGITDYCTLRSYRRVVAEKESGRLPKVELVFPNVEFRLTVETTRGKGINFHLLISPEDRDHVERAEERLARLKFDFRGEPYPCTDEGLVRLGRAFKGNPSLEYEAALREGAQQFKIELSALRALKSDDAWVRRNVLFAVAAGEDGLGGLAQDTAFKAARSEIGRLADIIFSAHPSDTDFWNGDHPGHLENKQKVKPCLHGSDAHSVDKVLEPDMQRRCWIRSTPTFEGLKQTLVEPERRVYIGPSPPTGPSSANTIRYFEVENADWAQTQSMELNDGLVTVIGARGSGKTAFVDLMAYALRADDQDPGHASFLAKAGKLLNGTKLTIRWANQSVSTLTYPRPEAEESDPRVRYLSQQFVERLCSGDVASTPLVNEIESVVFDAIPTEDRMGCTDFNSLRLLKLRNVTSSVNSLREQINNLTNDIANEREIQSNAGHLKQTVQDLAAKRDGIEQELRTLPSSSNDANATQFQKVTAALDDLKQQVAEVLRQKQLVGSLRADLKLAREAADASLAKQRRLYQDIDELIGTDWELLRFRPDERADERMQEILDELEETRAKLVEDGLPKSETDGESPYAQTSLKALEEAEKGLAAKLGAARDREHRRLELGKKLEELKAQERRATAQSTFASGATERIRALQTQRIEAYSELFQHISREQLLLDELYQPMRAIAEETGKLSFNVHRRVELDDWVKKGERLFDLRRNPFGGESIRDVARRELLDSWQFGTAASCSESMGKFVEKYGTNAVRALAQNVDPSELGAWLFSADHIRVEYTIQYESVALSELSPGTRGVVLLTLFLLLDQWDERPLIIDQPEENLDPKSVFAELVPYFKLAAKRRQVIMVTHNANLVVNTDSDQVVIATSRRTENRRLPDIKYTAGGLEDQAVRKEICSLLEGGTEAFRKRSARYGIEDG